MAIQRRYWLTDTKVVGGLIVNGKQQLSVPHETPPTRFTFRIHTWYLGVLCSSAIAAGLNPRDAHLTDLLSVMIFASSRGLRPDSAKVRLV
jgi:hypothetical protein